MVVNIDEEVGMSLGEFTSRYGEATERLVYFEAAILSVFSVLAGLGQTGVLIALVGSIVVVDGNAVGETHLMTTGNGLVDAVTVGFLADRGQCHTRAVVQNDVAGIVVLVEALGLVMDSQTAVHIDIHGALVGAALEAVTVTLWSNLCERKETVLIGNAVLQNDRHVVAKTTFLLVENIPAVIAVGPGTAAVEVVVVTYRELRSKTISIALVLIAVQVGIAVDDLIIRCQVLHL